MIYIFLRDCEFNQANNMRPAYFNYEKCFKNLIDTLDSKVSQLNVMFDGDSKNSHIEKYKKYYDFNINYIKAGGDHKSNVLTCECIKSRSDIKDNDLVYLLENDYLHLPWITAILDLYRCNPNYNMQNTYVSLFCHPDKMLFRNPNATNEWGIYKDLKCPLYLSNYRIWAGVPSTCRSFLMEKQLFDKDFDVLSSMESDNVIFPRLTKERNREVIMALPGLSTHCHSLFSSPLINWSQVSEGVKLL